RYIQDRFLPDKAIDLMDEAGSKLNLTIGTTGKEQVEDRLAEILKEKEDALTKEDYEKAAKLRDEEASLDKVLQSQDTQTSRPTITVEQIQALIEEKTGNPVGKLQEDEKGKMKHLAENLANKVIGQDEAVSKVAK